MTKRKNIDTIVPVEDWKEKKKPVEDLISYLQDILKDEEQLKTVNYVFIGSAESEKKESVSSVVALLGTEEQVTNSIVYGLSEKPQLENLLTYSLAKLSYEKKSVVNSLDNIDENTLEGMLDELEDMFGKMIKE